MKKITLVCSLFMLFFSSYGQEKNINTTFKKSMESAFEGLEKNRVPHGIL